MWETLRWLPVPKHIQFKILTPLHNSMVGWATLYLQTLCTPISSLPGRSALWSAAKGFLVAPFMCSGARLAGTISLNNCALSSSPFLFFKRLCLEIWHSDSGAQMLLDQSVMWLWKVTDLWCDSEMKFLSNDYTNPNANPKTLTITLTVLHNAFESFCAPLFCDFIQNYFLDSESECRTPRHFVFKGTWRLPYFLVIALTWVRRTSESLSGAIYRCSIRIKKLQLREFSSIVFS